MFLQLDFLQGFLDFFFMYFIPHCFICGPSDSIVSEDAGIEPRTVVTLALATSRSNQSAIYLIHTRLDLVHTRLDLILSRLDLVHTRLDLINSRLDLIHTRLDLTCNLPVHLEHLHPTPGSDEKPQICLASHRSHTTPLQGLPPLPPPPPPRPYNQAEIILHLLIILAENLLGNQGIAT
jgi:hypothetical protein